MLTLFDNVWTDPIANRHAPLLVTFPHYKYPKLSYVPCLHCSSPFLSCRLDRKSWHPCKIPWNHSQWTTSVSTTSVSPHPTKPFPSPASVLQPLRLRFSAGCPDVMTVWQKRSVLLVLKVPSSHDPSAMSTPPSQTAFGRPCPSRIDFQL